ncbi:Flavonoid 3' hydroxylase [Rhynchospora pubera]|uniref:Flavonoid 3' hydroxylase n=1 Tax=Rhynchospora pubera TaxID=906938 RepID=A0AAV8FW77_9POAL|nr:Flavonoid 3' hydroxylase [Rhynchospora pubera]
MTPFFLLLCTVILCTILYCFLFKKETISTRPPPPGPRGWPILGNLPQLGTKPHQTLYNLSKFYGPLIYLQFGSVNVVVASSSNVASQFLKTHDANFSNRPPNSGAEHMAYNYQDMVFAPYGSRWRALRKMCNIHLFSAKALDDLRPIRQTEVMSMTQEVYLHGKKGAVVDVSQVINVCSLDALSRALVGWKVFQEAKEAIELKAMVVELMQLAGVFNVGDFVKGLAWMDPQGVVRKMKKVHKRFDQFFDALMEARRTGKNKGEGRDLLSVLLNFQEDGADFEERKLTDTNIKALMLNLFTAGTDTSSSTVEWALSELIRHPDILKQAQEELDSVVGRHHLVKEHDLPNLPLFQAIIKEVFRLHPATPLSIPRVGENECEINGYRIPRNATLLVNLWAIGRDSTIWKDPMRFDPGRFFPAGPHAHADVKGNNFELIPFGGGRRICAGMRLGLRMVQIMTATLIHAFDWVLPDGQTHDKLDMEEAFGISLPRALPLVACPVPRLEPSAYEFAL